MWAFDLSQYGDVWKISINIVLLLVALLFGNALRRSIPFLRKAFIPSALLGGLLLFGLNQLLNAVIPSNAETGFWLIDKRLMQIITYHALGIGFIAMTFKASAKKKDGTGLFAIQNGLITGGTYMLQAVMGILVGLIFYWANSKFFYDAGVLLPLGFGQGPGNALTWDVNFGKYGLNTNGSLGLTIASIGFVVASIVGVIYINIFKRKGEIVHKDLSLVRNVEVFEEPNEIEDSESVDKLSIQIAFVAAAYGLSFLVMVFFAKLTDWTGVKLFNDVAWGFNFIWGVIVVTLMKLLMNFLSKKKIVKKKYINNYQMDRISGLAFDLMIIAGVVAIDTNAIKDYVWLIVAVSVVGAIATIIYVKFMTKRCFKNFKHEAFLVNFGTLTGTASNGMILLREIDPNYETPTSNIFVVSQFPAMVAVAPLLLLLNFSSKSSTNTIIAMGIFATLLIAYTCVALYLIKVRTKRVSKA